MKVITKNKRVDWWYTTECEYYVRQAKLKDLENAGQGTSIDNLKPQLYYIVVNDTNFNGYVIRKDDCVIIEWDEVQPVQFEEEINLNDKKEFERELPNMKQKRNILLSLLSPKMLSALLSFNKYAAMVYDVLQFISTIYITKLLIEKLF